MAPSPTCWQPGASSPSSPTRTDTVPQKEMDELARRMDGALEALRREFAGLRTGRASAHLLEPITVSAYGSHMPITQVGTISLPAPRQHPGQVWARGLGAAVERGDRAAG